MAHSSIFLSANVIGCDLRGGLGFKSFTEAKETLDPDNIPYQTLWMVDGEIFILKEMFGKPVFDFYEK